MRSLQSATLTAISQGVVGVAQLVELELPIPWYLNTSRWQLTWDTGLGTKTYLAAPGVGQIEEIEDTPQEIKPIRFTLPAIIDADLATALASQPQGRPVRIWTAIFHSTTYAILEAVLEWEGRLDTFGIAETETGSTIQATAEHIGIDLLRPSNILYTHQDQQRLHPGDNSFEFVVDQSEQEIVFPAASFFRK